MPDVLATASACVSVSAADGAFIFAYNLRERWTLGIRCARRNRDGVVKRCMEFELVVQFGEKFVRPKLLSKPMKVEI